LIDLPFSLSEAANWTKNIAEKVSDKTRGIMAFGEELSSYLCAQNGLFSHEVKFYDSAAQFT